MGKRVTVGGELIVRVQICMHAGSGTFFFGATLGSVTEPLYASYLRPASRRTTSILPPKGVPEMVASAIGGNETSCSFAEGSPLVGNVGAASSLPPSPSI